MLTERAEVSMLKCASHLLGELVKTDRWTHPAVLILQVWVQLGSLHF